MDLLEPPPASTPPPLYNSFFEEISQNLNQNLVPKSGGVSDTTPGKVVPPLRQLLPLRAPAPTLETPLARYYRCSFRHLLEGVSDLPVLVIVTN